MARKENALDLAKFIDKGVRVKLSGGREGSTWAASCQCMAHELFKPTCSVPCYRGSTATHFIFAVSSCWVWTVVEGVLKGYDQLLNLVLDETAEFLKGRRPQNFNHRICHSCFSCAHVILTRDTLTEVDNAQTTVSADSIVLNHVLDMYVLSSVLRSSKKFVKLCTIHQSNSPPHAACELGRVSTLACC